MRRFLLLFSGAVVSFIFSSCLQTGSALKTDSSKTISEAPCKVPGEQATKKRGEEKLLWADSYIWAKAPQLNVEKWRSEKPDTKGKYVLIEHWNTWCPPCRRSIKLLNHFYSKYKKDLVVIGVTDDTEDAIAAMEKEFGIKIDYYCAIDTSEQQKKALGVFGVPHVIILEPGGYVVWEGFPYQKGHELTDEIIDKIIAVGRKQKKKK